MYTDRPISGGTVDTGVDSALPAPSPSPTQPASDPGGAASSGRAASAGTHPVATSPRSAGPSAANRGDGDPAGVSRTGSGPDTAATADRGYLDPASTTERLRLLWSTGARDVTLVAPVDGEGHRHPGAIDPRGWIA